ncbi:gephyrin-like molybdotransferase receptor GlpR [Nocardia amikacinitolerans]|uniref:divisome protein SepX/GlpR n=1 Tax=Nocardia amikacinitolerans TaxID=756689 RepID=UPI00369B9C4C
MPNSILWIGLVVLWVFVLFPILADRHPRIRQTTDAALATRVLHRGGSKRRMKKGPAAGHDSDPDYRPTRVQRKRFHSDDAEDRMSAPADEQVTEVDEDNEARDDIPALEAGPAASAVHSGNADDEPAEADSGDTDDDAVTSEADRAADPESDLDSDLDSDENDTETARTPADADAAADDDDVADDDDEAAAYYEPTTARIPPARSGAPARVPDPDYQSDSDEPEFVPTRRGRGGFDPEADAMARAARYTFRQRAVLGLLLTGILCGALAIVVSPLLWWACGLSALVLGTYLAYLRRQVRMEEEIRRRRAARLRGRDASEDQHRADDTETRRGMDRETARALRRRSVLLDAVDEDPMFEHLDTFDPATARALRGRTSGDMRRAVGE